MEGMINTVFGNNDNDKIEELMVMIKLLSLSLPKSDSDGDDATIKVLVCVLSSCKGKSISSPYTVLEAITSIVTSSSSSSSSSKYKLQSNEAESIRNIIVQCLHGGAPEKVRDGTLSCIQDLLSSSSSCLSLSWTVEDKTNVGQFSMLLCSIVRGEFHLLLQELITLYDYSSDTSDTIDGNDSSKVKVEVIIARRERTLSMIHVCCSLMESFLVLLVGKAQVDDDNDSDDEMDTDIDDEIPLWSSLPYTCLLHMRESFHSVCQDIFEFIDTVTKKNGSSSIDMSRVISRLCEMISIWVSEDEGMIPPVIKYAPCIMKCSRLSSSSSSSSLIDSNSDNIETTIWTILTNDGDDVIYPFISILKTIGLILDNDDNDVGDGNSSVKEQVVLIPNLMHLLIIITTTICSKLLVSGYEEFQENGNAVSRVLELGYATIDILLYIRKWDEGNVQSLLHDTNDYKNMMVVAIRLSKLIDNSPMYDSIVPAIARRSLSTFKQSLKNLM